MSTLSIRSGLVKLLWGYKLLVSPSAYLTRNFIKTSAKLVEKDEIRICIEFGGGKSPQKKLISQKFGLNTFISSDLFPSDRTMVVANIEELPFAQRCADLVVIIAVLQYLKDPNRVAKDIFDVIKPGGYVLISYDFFQPECDIGTLANMTYAGAENMLESAGFSIISHKKRAGAFFALVSLLSWLIQYGIPGHPEHYRSPKKFVLIARLLIIEILLIPIHLLGWIALGLDSFFPSKRLYRGGLIFCKRPIDAISITQSL